MCIRSTFDSIGSFKLINTFVLNTICAFSFSKKNKKRSDLSSLLSQLAATGTMNGCGAMLLVDDNWVGTPTNYATDPQSYYCSAGYDSSKLGYSSKC